VIRGCVPKKLLVYASAFRDEFDDAGEPGLCTELTPLCSVCSGLGTPDACGVISFQEFL
jgi:hypothetical protein